MPRGIGEAPLDGSMTPLQRRVYQDMRQQIISTRGSQSPPAVPTNLVVTPQAFSNLLQFTRAFDADKYEVRHSKSGNPNDASTVIVDIGSTNQWVDQVGNTGIAKTYWVRSVKNNGVVSQWSAPASGTTLTSGTGVTPPTPPASGQGIVLDQQTNVKIPTDTDNRL